MKVRQTMNKEAAQAFYDDYPPNVVVDALVALSKKADRADEFELLANDRRVQLDEGRAHVEALSVEFVACTVQDGEFCNHCGEGRQWGDTRLTMKHADDCVYFAARQWLEADDDDKA